MDNPIKNKALSVKTLDEILADMNPVSAKTSNPSPQNSPATPKPSASSTRATPIKDDGVAPKPQTTKQPRPKKRQKDTHLDTPSAVSSLLTDDNQTVLDDNSLRLLSQVEIEKLQLPDKATRYMRWLAFYYLSRQELSRHELKAKLIAKECDPQAVDDLLVEFAQKGYQSDERCATMLVRESVRKGRGIHHLQDALKKAGLDAKTFGGIDELIALADVGVTDGTILEDGDSDEIDWLKLAVEARCKKYGNAIPKDPKEKARQLRFLQYRGYQMSVCFDALKMTLEDF